jgi:hypothetical protein
MKYMHNLLAWLYDNPLTDNPHDLYARIKANKSLTIADIAQSARERGGAAVSAEVIEQCVRLWLEEAVRACGDGFSVNADWFSFAIHIKGSFTSPHDRYDQQRHKLLIEFLENPRLRKYIEENVSVIIEGMASGGAYIDQVKDSYSGQVNSILTDGSPFTITGSRIKLAGDDPAVGVYLRNLSNGVEQKFPPASIVINNPSQLIVTMNSSLPTGTDVELIVRTQYSTGGKQMLKEPRSIVFDKTLTTSAQ